MRLTRIKYSDTPDGCKQRKITDFFGNSRSSLRKQLFIDEHNRPRMSSDEFETPRKKVTLPYPLSSSDEEINTSVNVTKKKIVSTPKSRRTTAKRKSNHSNNTTMQLNEFSRNDILLTPKTNQKAKSASMLAGGQDKSLGSLNNTVLKSSLNVDKKTSTNVKDIDNIQTPKKKFAGEQNDEMKTSSKKIKMNVDSRKDISAYSVLMTPQSSKQVGTQSSSVGLTCKSSNKFMNFSPLKTPDQNKINVKKNTPTERKEKRSPKKLKDDLKAEDEKETKLNYQNMELLKALFEDTLKDSDKKKLLTTADIDTIEEFLRRNKHHQYFLMKLFLYKPLWYNIEKFCVQIKLDQELSLEEIISMQEDYKDGKFVYTDMSQLSMDELLNLISAHDLNSIVKNFKLTKKFSTPKAALIEHLKKNCRTQTTLMKKSSEDVLKEAVLKKLGFCIKLKEEVWSSFYKAYLLQTYCNSSYYLDIQNYLKDIGFLKVQYPKYDIEYLSPFKNKEQFHRFYEVVLMKRELIAACENKNINTIQLICDQTFEKLKNINDDEKWKRSSFVHVQKFFAEYQYIRILQTGISKLMKNFEVVKIWLEFLIENYPTHHKIGLWYKDLAHLTTHKYKNYSLTAQILIDAYEFNKKENIFDFIQIYELNKLSNKIRSTKSYKLDILYSNKLIALGELPVDTTSFPKKFIKGCTVRSGTPGKRLYTYEDSNGEKTYTSVENVALKHYSETEEYEGVHCEGQLIGILFNTLFWDIIYEYYVPMTFISKLQSAPLDMYSDAFYKHRKEEIDSRLKAIANEWTSERLESTLKENLILVCQEKSITDLGNWKTNLDEVMSMFQCIDRTILSKILGRLVTNYRRFRSGLPDLFLWNKELSKCKLVEVKGENDILQPNQILWIQFLIEAGADVEVCHVSGVGAKKKLLKEDEELDTLEEENTKE